MAVVNKPVVPVQPKEARYSPEKLYLTPRLTREKYFELFGEEAPFYDVSRRPKLWFFTDVLEGSEDPANELVQFVVWDPVKKAVVPLVMSKLEASLPNIPGVVKFQEYKNPEATSAKLFGPSGDGGDGYSPLNGRYLIDPIIAATIVKEINRDLGTKFVIEQNPDPWPWKVIYGTETRRNLNFVNGSETRVGAFILEHRFRNGIGHPGKWVREEGSNELVFELSVVPSGSGDPRPEVPMPVRPLLPNERIESNPFATTIVRTDLTTNEPAPGTGSLTAAQDALLKKLASDVSYIKAKLDALAG